MRKLIHSIRCRVAYKFFGDIFREETNEMLHPEFGWYWRDDQTGGQMLKSARTSGYKTALRDIKRLLFTNSYNEALMKINCLLEGTKDE